MRARFFAAVFFAALSWAQGARAEAEEEASPKRIPPDYDGRGGDPKEDGAGVWAGRVILSPLYFTSEYLIRRPLGALTKAVEHNDGFRKIYDFFIFGPDHKAGIVPIAFVEFGFVPSIGAYGFWNDAFFVKRNDVRVHMEMWPDDLWLAGSVRDRYRFDDHNAVEIRAAGLHRPDQVFYGIGPETPQWHQSRYAINRFDVRGGFESRFWRRSTVELDGGMRKVDLSQGEYGKDPSVEVEAATGAFPVPYGFNRGYMGPYARAAASIDTRRHNVMTGSGFRVESEAETGSDFNHGPATGWVRWGAAATVTIDLNDRGRNLSFAVATTFADPIASNEIPFTEMATLGGDKWMRGYFPGRLVDRSAAVAQVRYDWPVAPWLDATIQTAVGNVYGEHLQGFDAKLLRVSAALGLSTDTNVPLDFLVGIGTETFASGAAVDSVRVTVGVPHSF
jgi:hypothetical protein